MGIWKASEISGNVHKIECTYRKARSWSQYVLLQSDQHWDSPYCDWHKLHRHLKEAQERNAPVIWAGDFFDAMQGRMDRRASKENLPLEFAQENDRREKANLPLIPYWDWLADKAAEAMQPYADVLSVCGYGNHETKVMKWSETDLLGRFVAKMKSHNPRIFTGGYDGYVLFSFSQENVKRGQSHLITLKYFHDPGSGGKRSKGVLSVDINIKESPSADIIVSGHIHRFWYHPEPVERISSKGTVRTHKVLVASLPSYKMDYERHKTGFARHKRHGPRLTGAWWLKFTFSKEGGDERIDYTLEEAN